MTDIAPMIRDIGEEARSAARKLATISGANRAAALKAMPPALEAAKDELMAANAADVEDAQKNGMAAPLVKRLIVDDKVFSYMTKRLREAAALPDPVGRILEGHTRPNGLRVEKVSVPIGVIGIIYESRPNVTTDAAAVCLKSGNAVILRGGSESLRTNLILADAMIGAATANGLPEAAVQIIREPGHEAVGELLKLDDCIDVLIPRGGKPLIKRIAEGTRIPVIKHYEGVCHLYVAKDATPAMAVDLAVNSKCQRVEVCNALETLLIDAGCAEAMLPKMVAAFSEAGVELRGCERCCAIAPEMPAATESDWGTEYLAPILSVRIVEGVPAAMEHIAEFGSGHTDAIVTNDMSLADRFVQGVDSGSVLVNASTRLSGGGDYGMGAVVGISTDKLHARGPVGPNDLTTYKWVARGDGHLRG